MKEKIIHVLQNYFPPIYAKLLSIKRKQAWEAQQKAYALEVARLKGTKEPLNVVFMVLYSAVWKYDSVYKLMEKDPRFKPLILVCPVADYGKEHMVENFRPTVEMFKKKGYNVMSAYDETTDTFVNIDDLKPDLLMYAFQWSSHVDPRYNVYTLQKYLKCYVNYSFKNNPFEWSIASREQGIMWMYFSECEDNKKLAQSFNQHEFQNIHVVGYPIYDEVQETEAVGKDWKIKDNSLKRIIWAPHHSIEGSDKAIKLSTFLLFADDMLELKNTYKDKVQFAFKPHPQLKPALYKHKDWGKERTDAYYKEWEEGENSSFVAGEYIDLFKSSDGMIHDSHSFTVEYLYVDKPVMFMTNYDRESQCNAVGKRAFAAHYHGTSREDIQSFIEDVVICGKDTMSDKRHQFYQEILVPPNGKSVAENIINEITTALEI